MGHKYGHFLTDKALVFRILMTYLRPVNIAMHSPQWPECPERLRHCYRPEIAGMPYFITWLKMPEHPVIQVSVRIRYKSDAGQRQLEN